MLETLTLNQLKQLRPDLVFSIKDEAISFERSRVVAIMKIIQTEFTGLLGMELEFSLPITFFVKEIEEAVANGRTPDAALAAIRSGRLKFDKSPGADAGITEKKDHLTRAKEYQALHKCTIVVALSATAPPRTK